MTQPLSAMTVTCPFGWRRHPVSRKRQFHNGVDLKAAMGTPVYAPFSGTVVLNENKAGGKQIILTNADAGLRAGFAHLSRYAEDLTSGSVVKEGDVVGYTGRTGMVTGPHLHYTLALLSGSGKRFFDPDRVVYSN